MSKSSNLSIRAVQPRDTESASRLTTSISHQKYASKFDAKIVSYSIALELFFKTKKEKNRPRHRRSSIQHPVAYISLCSRSHHD